MQNIINLWNSLSQEMMISTDLDDIKAALDKLMEDSFITLLNSQCYLWLGAACLQY